jgi:hypothetical protein
LVAQGRDFGAIVPIVSFNAALLDRWTNRSDASCLILRARLRALFRRESVWRDIEEELGIHVELETEANIERGMPPDEARAAALRSFGHLGRKTELGYDIRGGGWLETLRQDLRYGARRRTPEDRRTIRPLTEVLGLSIVDPACYHSARI